MADKRGKAKAASKRAKKSVHDDPPRKHVLLLSCMDQRLLDDTVEFMNSLSLQNRYDHVIVAGAAMGARHLASPMHSPGPKLAWKDLFFDHLYAAIEKLHREIYDVFLLEHLDCGAYKELHPTASNAYKNQTNLDKLRPYHMKEARKFATEVRKFCKQQYAATGNAIWKKIKVRCFVMDLIGNVSEL